MKRYLSHISTIVFNTKYRLFLKQAVLISEVGDDSESKIEQNPSVKWECFEKVFSLLIKQECFFVLKFTPVFSGFTLENPGVKIMNSIFLFSTQSLTLLQCENWYIFFRFWRVSRLVVFFFVDPFKNSDICSKMLQTTKWWVWANSWESSLFNDAH